MSKFVESLRRLYHAGKLTDAKLQQFVDEGKITRDEADYIRG